MLVSLSTRQGYPIWAQRGSDWGIFYRSDSVHFGACTESDLKKSQDLSHLLPIWPILGLNLVTLEKNKFSRNKTGKQILRLYYEIGFILQVLLSCKVWFQFCDSVVVKDNKILCKKNNTHFAELLPLFDIILYIYICKLYPKKAHLWCYI